MLNFGNHFSDHFSTVSTMTTTEPAASNVPVSRRPKRIWFPLASVGLMAALIACTFVIPADGLNAGSKVMLAGAMVVIAAALVFAWFLWLAGFSRSRRLTGVAIVAVAVAALALSVRRVEFSGEMIPIIDFRWSPDRSDVLEAHRAKQLRKSQGGAGTSDDHGLAVIAPSPHDVFDFRGPNRDGVIEGVRLARDWSNHPPKLVWRQPIGGGYASFVVAGPLAITIEQRRDQEAIVAYDFDTARELWKFEYPALFSETLGGDGPRATPTIHDGKLYSLGATGVLVCLDLASGGEIWKLNVLEENGAGNLDWGMSGSPLVVGGVVVVNPGNQKGSSASRSLVAYDLVTGKRVWAVGESKAGYASPILVPVAGRPQYIIFDGIGLAGFDSSVPAELWRVPWKSQFDINASQPAVIDGDRFLITSAAGATLVQVSQQGDQQMALEVWKNNKLKGYYASPIVYEDNIYGIDDTLMACLDLSTGKQRWKARAGDYGHGQVLRRGDLLLVLSEAGELALVEATPARFNELGRIQAIEGKTWNNPTLAGNRLLLRNHLEMAAYDLAEE